MLHRSGLLLAVLLLAAPAPATHLAPGSLAAAARSAGVEVGAAIEHDMPPGRQQIAATEFTSATSENRLKWGPLSPAPGVYDFTDADVVVDFAEQNDLRMRGHALFWDRLNGRPSWLAGEVAGAPDPAARLTQLMQDHAQTVVGRYAGRIAQWDVVNEPLGLGGGQLDPANLFFETLGESYLDIAFQAAHAADPGAKLFLNETLTESPPVFSGLLALAERLLGRGVPLHGIGLQSHYILLSPDRATLQAQLQQVAALGLLVEITELDLPLFRFAGAADPLAAQAEAYADVFAACVAVPACTGITQWGVDDGATWLDSFELTQQFAPNRPLLVDALGQPKPAYDAVVTVLSSVPEPSPAPLVLMAGGAALAAASTRSRGSTRGPCGRTLRSRR